MIPKSTIDQIMDATSIEEVIGDFVHLKKSGSSYKALSPFTEEKTPSFFVSPAKQIFKCFSSGKGGSAVTFLMEHEKWTYPEALKYLAKKYGIAIEEREESPEEIAAKSERESLAAVIRYAHQFFQDALHNSQEGRDIGLSYFKERGFSIQTIKEFELGYNPEQELSLSKQALENQFSEKYLLESGVSKEGRSGIYDFYRGRVIFPIHNISGQVLGFGARTLKADKKIPKYLNSPENELYNKSKVLYGLYQAKNHITREDTCYLVEGYTDVISLHQAGVKNVLASSGTSLTADQVKLIKRYTKNVVILFDGDAAGIKASFRGINLFLQEGLAVKACLFPDGEDPDSFANSHSTEELKQFLSDNAKDFVSFKTEILKGDSKSDDPLSKVAILKDLAETIAQIPDALSRSIYCRSSAALLDVEEQLLLREINKFVRSKNRDALKKQADVREENPEDFLLVESPTQTKPELKKGLTAELYERELLRVMLLYGSMNFIYRDSSEDGEMVEAEVGVRDFILDTLEADNIDFDIARHQEMLRFIREHRAIEEMDAATMENSLAEFYADLIYEPYELSPNWEKKHFIFTSGEKEKIDQTVVRSLYSYLLIRVEMEIRNIQEKLKSNPAEEEVIELLKSQKDYDRAKMKLSDQLSRVIIR
ncbi:MAG: DNA primase [Luteibaculum sp.]